MLERIALHQTRLRTPGLGLDAKGVALGAKDFRREDKPGTSALIARQLRWMIEGTDTIKVSLKTVLDIQDAFDKGAGFADLAGQFEKLRLIWQDELVLQR